MIKLWIDDVRKKPEDDWILIQSVHQFIEWFEENEQPLPDIISIDHDAGAFWYDGGDYIKILDYLENQQIKNLKIHIHSQNPVGVENMARIIQKNGWKRVLDYSEYLSNK